jgi:hypothetical protein
VLVYILLVHLWYTRGRYWFMFTRQLRCDLYSDYSTYACVTWSYIHFIWLLRREAGDIARVELQAIHGGEWTILSYIFGSLSSELRYEDRHILYFIFAIILSSCDYTRRSVHVLLCYIYVYIRNRYFSVMPCGYLLSIHCYTPGWLYLCVADYARVWAMSMMYLQLMLAVSVCVDHFFSSGFNQGCVLCMSLCDGSIASRDC